MTFGDECNCGNCSHFEGHACTLLGDRMANCEIVLIERVGCLSHPRAREVMMAGVLDKLEMNIADAKKERNHERVEGYRKAIKLIRGGGRE